MVQEKQLIDEVSGWLRLYDDGSVDRTWTGPPQVKFMAEPVNPHDEFINGVSVKDLTIDPNSNLRVRIYLPESTIEQNNDKLPIILHFHGGGFCISQADWFMYYNIYAPFAKSCNAIIVSVDLRLAPEHRLPAAVQDGLSALLWLRLLANSKFPDQFNDSGDFKRVFLIGDSSGANLVHEVAAKAGELDLSPLKLAGGIPIHPGFVRSERSKSELENPESPFLTLDMVDKFLSLALPVGATKDHPITCPMGSAAPALEKLNLPPFLLCIAENDLIKDTEMEYYEAMKKGNKEVELLISPGMGHSFYLNKIAIDLDPFTAAQTSALFDGIKEFIQNH